MDVTSGLMTNITSGALSNTVNNDQQIYNQIKGSNNTKDQLKKTSEEFESIFITQMLTTMDKTVDKTGSLFSDKEGGYLDTFKSYMYQEMGRNLASNPRTSFGFAKQIYTQMEKFVK